MRPRIALFPALLLVGLTTTRIDAAAPPAATLARRIDERIAAGWAGRDVHPVPLADDATFLRRVRLDLTGTIPTASEVRAFLDDRSPDKRAVLVERLLASPGYVRHFTAVWRARWLSQADQSQNAALVPGFEAWLRQRLRDNAPYDRLIAEMLTGTASSPAVGSPAAFLQAIERTPEGQAGVTARLFLGLNVDCAQCHNHPFARWTRQQFWEYAAFFASPETASGGSAQLALLIPGTEKRVKPRHLNGDAARLPDRLDSISGRATLAAWMTDPDNSTFARNAVNRLWADLFGVGLVEPLDDLSGQVPASHPELLDDLATAFRESGYDLKYLLKALTLSATYQRASVGPEVRKDAGDPRLFSRMPTRLLDGESLFASLLLATGSVEKPGSRAAFVATFGRPERPSETQRTILQALQLMNGSLVADATSLANSRALAAINTAPYLDDAGRVETVFLTTLSRFPTPAERTRFTAYVTSGGPGKDSKRALGDLFWALLNSNEFGTNH